MNFSLFSGTFILFFSTHVFGQKTFLDSASNIGIYRALKELALVAFGRTGDDYNSNYHEEGRYQRRVQHRIPSDVPFPCNVSAGRSKNVPKSVHELRPGDIDVIGAMGDSLTGGSGIFANSIFHLTIENRGVTALGGGQATWRDYLTIPNIIKEFNPNLIGYSLYDSLTHQKDSGFNVAEIIAMSRDLPFMAKNIIERMKNHPQVDINNHWKLISILIGANDFCSDMCWIRSSPRTILENHKNDLIKTLRIFKENLPRTLISIIPPPNIMRLLKLRGKPKLCSIVSDIECACLVGLRFRSRSNEFSNIMSAWQKIDEEVASYPEFQTDDFAVVVQPFSTNITVPIKRDGTGDWRYLSVDCFHLSQIGHARASRALWKNMLEPASRKSREWDDSEILSCPNESRPYIATLANSREQFNSGNIHLAESKKSIFQFQQNLDYMGVPSTSENLYYGPGIDDSI